MALVALPAAAQQNFTFEGTKRALTLEKSEGRLIKLDDAAASVFVADPEVANVNVKSPKIIYVFGLKPGETTLYAVDQMDEVVASLHISVTQNMSRLSSTLTQVLPGSQVRVRSVDGGIVLTGQVRSPADADDARRLAARFLVEGEEVINQLQVVGSSQVNLRVRVAEVAKEIINEFGFNWDAAFNADGAILGIATGNPVLPLGLPEDLASVNTISPAPGGSFLTRNGLEANSIFGRYSRGNWDVNSLIDALAQDNLVTLLAEPNLTAITGETASFLAGGEFPIPVSQDDGQVSIEFKKFGVSLVFTPTVLSGNRISMRIRPDLFLL